MTFNQPVSLWAQSIMAMKACFVITYETTHMQTRIRTRIRTNPGWLASSTVPQDLYALHDIKRNRKAPHDVEYNMSSHGVLGRGEK